MPKVDTTFVVDAPVEDAWNYMSNMENIGSCVPGCTVEVVDDATSNWEIIAKMGPISKKIKLTNNVTVRDDENHHVEFAGEGALVSMSGRVDMEPADAGTQVAVVLEINGQGSAAGLLNSIINSQVGTYTDYFVESANKALA